MMQHTIYKTVNDITGEYYIGIHRTENPNDSYLGSGVNIVAAIKSIGRVYFKKEILFSYLNLVGALQKERELLALHLPDPLCYNTANGGGGSFEVKTHSAQ